MAMSATAPRMWRTTPRMAKPWVKATRVGGQDGEDRVVWMWSRRPWATACSVADTPCCISFRIWAEVFAEDSRAGTTSTNSPGKAAAAVWRARVDGAVWMVLGPGPRRSPRIRACSCPTWVKGKASESSSESAAALASWTDSAWRTRRILTCLALIVARMAATTASFPPATARSNGVSPLWFACIGFAPRSSKAVANTTCPNRAASWRGVSPAASCTWTERRHSSSRKDNM
mmetsp:Transcript_95255/g.218177  ORF Transcript_95255/g.218177 Transcript_95255/m.218177 type:complete len:231 (+) Transcript_95255:580-1272(+)